MRVSQNLTKLGERSKRWKSRWKKWQHGTLNIKDVSLATGYREATYLIYVSGISCEQISTQPTV